MSSISIKHLIRVALLTISTSIWSFTWQPPVNISVPGSVVEDVHVAVDPAGNAVAIWYRSNGVNTIIQEATLPFGGAWTAPVDLSDLGQNAINPQVAIDPTGNAIAVWQRSNGVDFVIQTRTLPFGGAWTPTVDISTPSPDTDNPHVAIDADGNAVFVWHRSDGANAIIQSRTLPFGGVLTPTVDLSAAGEDADNPQVSIGANGSAVAIWERFDGANTIIQARTLLFGGAWTSTVDLSSPGQDAAGPQVAVDSDGNAIAIWGTTVGANTLIEARTLPFGGSWSPTIDVSGIGIDTINPQVAVDGIGNAIAVWQHRGGSHFHIETATLPFGGVWTTPTRISELVEDSINSQIAIDNSGNAVVVWQHSNGVHFHIEAATLPFGGAWTAPVLLSDFGSDSIDAHVAVNGVGNVVAVWKNNGVNAIAQASIGSFPLTILNSNLPAPPTNGTGRQVVTRFPMQSERFNELKWTASASNIIGYRIYRNGVLISENSANQLSYRDHLQKKGAPTTYQVTAVDDLNNESTGLTIVVQ